MSAEEELRRALRLVAADGARFYSRGGEPGQEWSWEMSEEVAA